MPSIVLTADKNCHSVSLGPKASPGKKYRTFAGEVFVISARRAGPASLLWELSAISFGSLENRYALGRAASAHRGAEELCTLWPAGCGVGPLKSRKDAALAAAGHQAHRQGSLGKLTPAGLENSAQRTNCLIHFLASVNFNIPF
jgi:hypothetical protein